MALSKMTYLICFDDHRSFTEEIKKRFSDSTRYKVTSFQTREDFISHLRNEKDNKSCKVAIIGIPDAKEQYDLMDDLTAEIKKIDTSTGLVLLASADKMDDVKRAIKFNIDAYVPRNVNSILRIHNIVKKLISEHNIVIYRKRRNIALYSLLAFILISAFVLIFSYLKYPGCF